MNRNISSGFSFRQFYPNPELNFDNNTAKKLALSQIMSRSTANVSFYCRESKKNKEYLDYVTTNGYCQRVKTIVQFGIDNGKIKINPFYGIKLRRGEKSVQFLSEEEVEKIRSTDFHNESLNRVRDLFVFQAASGLS